MVDQGGIVFYGRWHQARASVLGRSVAFEIDGVDLDAGQAWSVIVKGHAVELDGMSDLLDALELPLFPWHASPKHHFVRIEATEMSGRRFEVVELRRRVPNGAGSPAEAAPIGASGFAVEPP